MGASVLAREYVVGLEFFEHRICVAPAVRVVEGIDSVKFLDPLVDQRTLALVLIAVADAHAGEAAVLLWQVPVESFRTDTLSAPGKQNAVVITRISTAWISISDPARLVHTWRSCSAIDVDV